MHSKHLFLVSLFVILSFTATLCAQQNQVAPTSINATASLVPRLIRFSGTLLDEQGQPMKSPVGVSFALYSQQSGTAALWMETQNVETDGKGNYSVLLGANSPNGVPAELFNAGEARWLGVQAERQAEQPRVLLVSVLYALKAGDAQTLGGLPSSAFAPANANTVTNSSTPSANPPPPNFAVAGAPVAAPMLSIGGSGTTNFIPLWTNSSTLGNSLLFQTGGKLGIGTSTPAATFDVRGSANSLQGVTSSSTGTGLLGSATSATGATFGVQGLSASTSGVGVLGKNTAATGSTFGVQGAISERQRCRYLGEEYRYHRKHYRSHGTGLQPDWHSRCFQ